MLIPIGTVVIIKPDEDDVSPGGLLIPPNVKQDTRCGTVKHVGPGIPVSSGSTVDEPWKEAEGPTYFPMQAEVGDKAIFISEAAKEFRYDGEALVAIPQGAILALDR